MKYSLKRLITVKSRLVSLSKEVLSSDNTVGSRKIKFVKLTKNQKAILIGTMLGDAFLQKTGKCNARLRFEHGEKQRDYLLWKIDKFPRLFQGEPKYLERKHPISGKTYRYWRHQSYATPELGKWHTIFYADGKKHIPENLKDLLKNQLSLAVWYMDDGYYYHRDRVSYFYLGRISRLEAIIAQNAIESNFGIHPKLLDKKQKGFALYFSPKETVEFHKQIKKFILPLFYYKISESNGKSS